MSVAGRLVRTEDLGSPPLGSSFCPPLRALLCLCRRSLSSGQRPHPDPLIMTMLPALTLLPCVHACLTKGRPFTMYLLSTNPTQLQIFLSITGTLFVRKHDSVPTNKSTRVIHQLGLTWWAVLRVSCYFTRQLTGPARANKRLLAQELSPIQCTFHWLTIPLKAGLGTAFFSIGYVPFFSVLFKERSVLFRSFFKFLATSETQKNVPFFYKELKRTQRSFRSFEKNGCPTLFFQRILALIWISY